MTSKNNTDKKIGYDKISTKEVLGDLYKNVTMCKHSIKVLLPQSSQQTSAKPLTRVIIDRDLNYYTAFGNDDEMPIVFEELTDFLIVCSQKEPEMYVALYADESVPYKEIVKVLNIANENQFKVVLATRRPDRK